MLKNGEMRRLLYYGQTNEHLNPFVNSKNCNFTLIKQCYAGGVFCRIGCPMPARPTDEGTSPLAHLNRPHY